MSFIFCSMACHTCIPIETPSPYHVLSQCLVDHRNHCACSLRMSLKEEGSNGVNHQVHQVRGALMHREQQSLVHCCVASVYVVLVALISTISILVGSIQHHILSHWSSVDFRVVGIVTTIVIFAYLMRFLFHRFARLGFVIDKCQIVHRSARQSRVFDWSSIRIDKDHRIDFVSADLKHLHGGLSDAKKRSLEEALLIRHRQREMSQLKQLPESAPHYMPASHSKTMGVKGRTGIHQPFQKN